MNVILMMIVAVLCWSGLNAAHAQSVAVGKGFESFRGLRTRNIFDPDRRGPRVESAPAAATSSRPPFLQLTGTMISGGKTLAFFSGSQPEFNKVLAVQGKVGEYTVVSITPAQVSLERAGASLVLPVGKQLVLDGSGTVAAAQPITGPGGSSGSSSPTSSSTEPPAGVPADKAEVLRRMMERRQQEVSK